jgi:hypothetical protein
MTGHGRDSRTEKASCTGDQQKVAKNSRRAAAGVSYVLTIYPIQKIMSTLHY